MSKAAELEFVIATYHERIPLSWMDSIPTGKGIKVSIYRARDGLSESKKDQVSGVDVTLIPNGGREAGQYLWHIIHNYKSLAKVTVFLQGDATRHTSEEKLKTLSPVRFWEDGRKMAYIDVPVAHDTPWTHPMADLHKKIHAVAWGDEIPASGMFTVGAHIWVRKELILSNSRSHYEAYYKARNEGHFAHVLEGQWHTVFGAYK